MARIETDPNYTAPTFSRATAGTDLFKKEDVQGLAAAVSTHEHGVGKGLPVTRFGVVTTNLEFASGSSQIIGDVVELRPRSTNANNYVNILPSGTGNLSALYLYNSSILTPSSMGQVFMASDEMVLSSTRSSAGAVYKPLSFRTSDTTRMSIAVDGTIGTSGSLSVGGAVSSMGGNFTTPHGYVSTGAIGTIVLGTTVSIQGSGGNLNVSNTSGAGAIIIPGYFMNTTDVSLYLGGDTTARLVRAGGPTGAAGLVVNPQLGIGSANVNSNGVLFSCHGSVYGGIFYSTTGQFVTWPSQAGYKSNPLPIEGVLDALADPSLRGMQYSVQTPVWSEPLPSDADTKEVYMGPDLTWEEPSTPPQYGFIAEAWQDKFPELIVEGPEGINGFNSIGMIPITWEAVRGLHAELQALKQQVAMLEAKPA